MQSDRHLAGGRGIAAASALLAAALLVLLLSPSVAAAGARVTPTATPSGSNNTQQWAYGTHSNFSADVTNNRTSFNVSGWFAYHVILTQTNITPSIFEVKSDRTFGFAYNATGTFCMGICPGGLPVKIAIHVRALEVDVGYANFTRNGTVLSNGSAVPALGLLNGSTGSDAHYLEYANYSAPVNGHTYTVRNSLRAALWTAASVSFAPALGLVPAHPAPGMNWTSSANFTSSAAAWGSVVAQHVAWNGAVTNVSSSLNPSFNHTGNVTLFGADLGTITLANGATVPIIALGVDGPFVAHEGIMFLPRSADLFGPGAAPYAGSSSGSVKAGTRLVDWTGESGGHMGLLASNSGMTPAPTPASGTQVAPGTTMMSSAVSLAATPQIGSNPPPAQAPPMSVAQFQGQPESVAAAESGTSCILAGTCGGTGTVSPPPTTAHALFGAIVVVSAVLVLAGLLAALVVARRQTPKPPRSSTPAYPPAGVAAYPAPSAPGAKAPGTAGPSSPENDPLAHLW